MRRLLRPALVALVIAVVARVDPVLGVVVLLAGWAASSWWLPPRALQAVVGTRSHPERALFGETVPVELRVDAGRRLPWLHVTDAIPFDLGPSTRWVTSSGPGESHVHTVEVRASRRGLHAIGPAVAASGDSFGLRRVQRTLVPASWLLIYPRIVPLETLTMAAGSPLPLVPTRTPLYEDPTRVVGVRDYQPGDPFRRIHWTATASTGTLVVKKHRPAIARDVVVALDLTRRSHPVPGRGRSAEIAITAAASIVHHLVTVRNEAVGLRIVGRDTPTGEDTVVDVGPGRDAARLARMLEHLARSDLSASAPFDALLDPAGLPFGASVVLLTGRPDRRHVLDVIRLQRLGIAVTAVVTAQHGSDWVDELRRAGIPVRPVARLAELVEL